MSVTLRPATPEDDRLLGELYRTSRLDEVGAWGWPAEAVDAFLAQQWEAARRARPMQYPAAEHSIIELDGVAIGHVLVDRRDDALHVVDLALLPTARSRGVGTDVLRRVIAEAGRRAVELDVLPGSRAQQLYERLGFRTVGQPAPYQSLRLETV